MRAPLAQLTAGWTAFVLVVAPAARAVPPGHRHPDSPVLAVTDTLKTHGQLNVARAYVDSLLAAQHPPPSQRDRMCALLWRGADAVTRGDMAAAERDVRAAFTIATALHDTLAALWGTHILMAGHAVRGEFATADSLNRRLLELAGISGSLEYQGQAFMVRAYMKRQNGHPRAAMVDYQRALKLYQKIGDLDGELHTRAGIANVSYEAGDMSQARAAYVELIEVARRSHNTFIEATGLSVLGSIEYNLGELDLAVADWNLAEARYRELANHDGLMRIQGNKIVTFELLDQWDALERTLVTFRAEAERANDPEMVAWALAQSAVLRAQQGRLIEAIELAHQAEARLDSLPPEKQLDPESFIASTYELAHQPEEALKRYRRLEEPVRTPDPAVLADARLGASSALIALGRPREALGELARAAPAKSSLSSLGREPDSAAICARAYTALGKRDSAVICLKRAIGATDRLRDRVRSPDWREARYVRRPELLAAYAELLLGSPGVTPSAATIRSAFDELERHRAPTFLERLTASDSTHGSHHPIPPVTLEHLQHSVLREGETLLDYFASDTGGVMFIIDRTSARVRTLPDARQLETTLSVALGWLSNASSTADERDWATGDLERVLIGEQSVALAHRRVLIVADDRLSTVPFALLLEDRNGDIPECALIPSATVLSALRTRGGRSAPRVMLALAAARSAGEAPLEGAKREVESLAREFGGVDTRLSPPTGSEAQMLARLGEYQIVHLAGHGVEDSDSPWRSGISLGGAGASRVLRGTDVAGAHLGTRLSVLSSCGSAGVPIPGEGMGGLSSAFLIAGSASVVATLWPVDDRVTAQFMGTFYRRLAGGACASLALRDAQQKLKANAATSAPFYWSGFALLGLPETTVRLQPRAGAQP